MVWDRKGSHDPTVFGPRNCKDTTVIYWGDVAARGVGFLREDQELGSGYVAFELPLTI